MACREQSLVDSGRTTTAALIEPTDASARSDAGRSADAEYARRRASRARRVRSAHPRIGGLLLALSPEPTHITAWARGADGEREVGRRLDALKDRGVVAIHDRRAPGARWNIDHIAIGPSGVFVIDAKRYSGRVTAQTTRSLWRSEPTRLVVGGRDCTKLVAAMTRQVAAVSAALDTIEPSVAVVPMLAFVGAEWSLLGKPLLVDGVWVGWPRAMVEVVSGTGPLTRDQIGEIARLLADRLPAYIGPST